MKKIILLFILSFSALWAAEDFVDSFIDKQIEVEKELLDQNISKEARRDIIKKQDNDYKNFFFLYAADKKNYSYFYNPYTAKMSKLKIRLSYNRNRGYTYAVLRDEVMMQEYYLHGGLRTLLHKVVLQIDGHSKEYFREKVDDMIAKAFASYKPLEKQKYYEALKKSSAGKIVSELRSALEELEYLESVTNTFSAKLIEHSDEMYVAGKISNSRFFAFVYEINQLPIAKKLNRYLLKINLDSAHIIILAMIILSIVLINLLIHFVTQQVLKHRKISDEDREYIHQYITKLIYIITTIMIAHLTLVMFFGLDITSITISRFFTVLYIILISLLLYRITNTVAYFKMEKLQQNRVLKKEVLNLLIKATNILILIIAVIGILIVFGVDLTALLSGLGIGGFAVAFAAKDSIANIFGSISILLGNLFEQGDWITGNGIDGTVVEIGLRATTLRTFDNALISVPNFKLASEEIKNWSKRLIGRRIKMIIGVTYESDFGDIKQAIEEIRIMLREHPGIAGSGTKYQKRSRSGKLVSIEDFRGIKRTTLVYMDEFADSSINILVYCFSKSVAWEEWLAVKEDVMYKIAEILKKNNLEFAYPALTVHQASDDHNSNNERGV